MVLDEAPGWYLHIELLVLPFGFGSPVTFEVCGLMRSSVQFVFQWKYWNYGCWMGAASCCSQKWTVGDTPSPCELIYHVSLDKWLADSDWKMGTTVLGVLAKINGTAECKVLWIRRSFPPACPQLPSILPLPFTVPLRTILRPSLFYSALYLQGYHPDIILKTMKCILFPC